MAGRKRGTANASRETIQKALSLWIRLGSSKAAAAELKLSDSSLRTWKERNPDLWDDLRQAHVAELQQSHAEHVRRAWADLNEAAEIAMERIRSRDYDNAREFLALSKVVSEFAFRGDTVARLDAGSPTAIREDRRRDLDLLEEIRAATESLGLTIDGLPDMVWSSSAGPEKQ